MVSFCHSQFPFNWGWYAKVMRCSLPIMLRKTLLTLSVVYLNLHMSMSTYNLIQELSNGGVTFIFKGFSFYNLLKYSIQRTKCFKSSTSGRLHLSIPICCITSVLMGILWSSLYTFLSLPCFWHLPHFLINSLKLPLVFCQKNLFEISYIAESLPQCEAIALAFGSCPSPLWTCLIIMYCCSVEEINSIVLLYINCPWMIEKVLQSFRKLAFYLYLPLYSMDRHLYGNTFQLLQN